MFKLEKEQSDIILNSFESQPTLDSAYSWSRRQYAHMYIHRPEFENLRAEIQKEYPDHVITFDVVFEAAAGKTVHFHSDYESLGPFEYDSYYSIGNHNFISVHFNLTPKGGNLRTLDWPLLSWLHHKIITWYGIYSLPHKFLNSLCTPLFTLFSRDYSNDPNVGNAFDNLRLHSVTPGDARISFVVRLVHKKVRITKDGVLNSVIRSSACERLAQVILPAMDGKTRINTEDVTWSDIQRPTD
jgi:hypothetical protein|tara:strand:+ start:6341 stop:7066 length:726 start_codon:yes stop_codon:yes gene_type:complete